MVMSGLVTILKTEAGKEIEYSFLTKYSGRLIAKQWHPFPKLVTH